MHGILTLNDFESIAGDFCTGIRSLPVQLGPRRATRAACWTMALPRVAVVALLWSLDQPVHASVVAGLLGVAVGFGAVRRDEAEPPTIGVVLHRRGQGQPPFVPPEALRAAFEKLLRQLGRTPLDERLRATRAHAEEALMHTALERCGGDAVLAAERLGIGRADCKRRALRVGLPRIE